MTYKDKSNKWLIKAIRAGAYADRVGEPTRAYVI